MHGPREPTRSLPYPVVGFAGSSADIELLRTVLRALPARTGAAFVLYLGPPRRSEEAIDWSRFAGSIPLDVRSAAEEADLAPDRLVVAGDEGPVVLVEGRLEPSSSRSHASGIDDFFHSLAVAPSCAEGRIAGVLVSDPRRGGRRGLDAVVDHGGYAFLVEDRPGAVGSARGIPKPSAPGTVAASRRWTTTSALELSSHLLAFIEAALEPHPRLPEDRSAETLRRIFRAVRARTGNDFRAYKTNTMLRRIERRSAACGYSSIEAYAAHVVDDPAEAERLASELLVVVTSFFRDEAAFDALSVHLRSLLLERSASTGHGMKAPTTRPSVTREELRVWVAGCATGEEAYSVAIVLHELLHELAPPIRPVVFATDLDPECIRTARRGLYGSRVRDAIRPDRLARYFLEEPGGLRIHPTIRDMVIFAPQNLISDPPFGRLDLLVCRNLLIYFDAEQQQRLLPIFGYALSEGGLLFLGPSETLPPAEESFEAVDRRWKIYRRTRVDNRRPSLPHPRWRARDATTPRGPETIDMKPRKPEPGSDTYSEQELQRVVLARFSPACVLVGPSGDVVLFNGRTGRYLEPAAGAASFDVVQMARPELAEPLRAAMAEVAATGARTVTEVEIRRDGERTDTIRLAVEPTDALGGPLGSLLVSFSDVTDLDAGSSQSAEPSASARSLEDELRNLRAHLQSTIEELEASNEDLRSTNEELQSTNEELNSTNEELETSKEELQSLNEELNTVNTQLNAKVEELSHANDDMQNLLNSIDVASVFLDHELRVKRYTEQARQLISLVDQDLGRPLSDLALRVDHPRLIADCRRVLDTLQRCEVEVRDDEGRWLMMRLLPYRTSLNVVDGVVVTFIPIDALKKAEEAAQSAQVYFESIVQTVRHPLVVLDARLVVRTANEAFYGLLGVTPEHVQGRRLDAVFDGVWSDPAIASELTALLPAGEAIDDLPVVLEVRDGRREFMLSARGVSARPGQAELLLLTLEPVRGAEGSSGGASQPSRDVDGG